jgi:hypothetical protein
MEIVEDDQVQEPAGTYFPPVAEHEIPPDDVLVEMFGMLEAQGAGPLLELLRTGHRQRGIRLFKLETAAIMVPPGLDQALGHFAGLLATFEDVEDLQPVAVLMNRARSDMESAIDALLTGRRSIVADEMRDVMEIEWLLRDFAARKENLVLWATTDDDIRAKTFWPAEVRRRLSNDAWPGKGFDLPDKREYDVHSQGLHPTPGHPHSAKDLDEGADPTDLLQGAGEILEHCRRVFDATDVLLDAFGVPDDRRPPHWQQLELMAAGHTMWISWIEEAKKRIRDIDPNVLPERGPLPRKRRKPITNEPRRPTSSR